MPQVLLWAGGCADAGSSAGASHTQVFKHKASPKYHATMLCAPSVHCHLECRSATRAMLCCSVLHQLLCTLQFLTLYCTAGIAASLAHVGWYWYKAVRDGELS